MVRGDLGVLRIVLAAAVLLGCPAAGWSADSGRMSAGPVAAARFPQPVLVADLPGRYFLEPTEAQRVLGRVGGVYRAGDGTLQMLVERGGVLGVGTTPVLVPVADVALLGEHVTLIGLSRRMFEALPRADLSGLAAVPAETSIKVAIVGPYH